MVEYGEAEEVAKKFEIIEVLQVLPCQVHVRGQPEVDL